jgi:hypothetical protein
MGDVESFHRLDRLIEHLATAAPVGGAHLPPQLPKLAQHPRPIEALPFAMFAKTHR